MEQEKLPSTHRRVVSTQQPDIKPLEETRISTSQETIKRRFMPACSYIMAVRKRRRASGRRRTLVRRKHTLIRPKYRALKRQMGGSFMDKNWWERLGKNIANTAVTMGTLGMADVPFKD